MASGGLDSSVLAFWMDSNGYEVYPLFIDYGQHCAEKEISTLKKILPPHILDNLKTIRLEGIFRDSPSRLIKEADLWKDKISSDDITLPYRNILLLSAGAAFASSQGIHFLFAAFINSNHAKEIDATESFLKSVSLFMNEMGFGVSIEFPFRNMSKQEVAQKGLELNAPIAMSYSCQVNSKMHCGACPNCVDRLNAFEYIKSYNVSQ